jgi:hypothetical protein
VSRHQENVANADQFVAAQLVGVITDQHAEDVVTPILPMPIHQEQHVRVHLARVLGLLLARNRDVQHGVAAALKLRLIFERHAEQLTDH